MMKNDNKLLDEAVQLVHGHDGPGFLLFLNCDVAELQGDIVAGLESRLGAKQPLTRSSFDKLQLDELDGSALNIIVDYPFARADEDTESMVSWHRRFADGLLASNALTDGLRLKLIMVCPQGFEDILALLAPAFYAYRTRSLYFDDRLVRDEYCKRRREKGEDMISRRLNTLEQQLKHATGWREKAGLHMEIAQLNLQDRQEMLAMEHYARAEKYFTKKKASEDLVGTYLKKAVTLEFRDLHREAASYFQQYLHHWEVEGSPETIAKASMFYALNRMNLCRHREAVEMMERAQPYLRGVEKLHHLRAMGSAHHHLGNAEMARVCFEQLEEELEAYEGMNPKALMLLHSTLRYYYHYCGDEQKSLHYLDLMSDEWDQKIASFWAARALRAGDWEKAEGIFLRALTEQVTYSDRASFKYDMANYAARRGRMAQAEVHARQALEHLSKIDHVQLFRETNALFLKILTRVGKYEEAEPLLRRYLKEWDEGPMIYVCGLHQSLAYLLMETGRRDEAAPHLEKVLALDIRNSFKVSEAETRMLLAKLHTLEGRHEAAYEELAQAQKLARGRDTPLEAEIFELLGDAGTQTGNSWAKAWYSKAQSRYRRLRPDLAEKLAARLAQ